MNEKHYPAGSEKGGQFAPKNGGVSFSETGRPMRKQLDIWDGKEDFETHCVDMIMKESGMSLKEAVEVNNSLQKYFNAENFNPEVDSEIIDKFLSNIAIYDGTIYRGLSFDNEHKEQLQNILNNYKEGNIIKPKKLKSWTSSGNVVLDFGNAKSNHHDTVIFKCKNNKSGCGVQHLSVLDEHEVLCSTTASYRVKSVTSEYKLKGITDEMAERLGIHKIYMIEVEEI